MTRLEQEIKNQMAQTFTAVMITNIAQQTMEEEEVQDRSLCAWFCQNYRTTRCQCPGPIVPRGGLCEGGFEIKGADFIEAQSLIAGYKNSRLLQQVA